MDNPAKAFVVLLCLAGVAIILAYSMMTLEEHRLNTTPPVTVQRGTN